MNIVAFIYYIQLYYPKPMARDMFPCYTSGHLGVLVIYEDVTTGEK